MMQIGGWQIGNTSLAVSDRFHSLLFYILVWQMVPLPISSAWLGGHRKWLEGR